MSFLDSSAAFWNAADMMISVCVFGFGLDSECFIFVEVGGKIREGGGGQCKIAGLRGSCRWRGVGFAWQK